MTPIARCNGVVLVESGQVVRLIEEGGRWIPTARYVAALVALIVGVNGIANPALPFAARLVMVAIGVLSGAVAVWLHRQRKAPADGPQGGVTIAIFDFGAGLLRDPSGQVMAPLSDVRLSRTWQLTSSARALSMSHPSFGRVVLARGNPFGDSVSEIEDALVARGLRQGDG